MNERITELLEQATTSIKDESGHWIGSELDEEKFAELIVIKCAEIADTAEPFLASDLIKKHFGVK